MADEDPPADAPPADVHPDGEAPAEQAAEEAPPAEDENKEQPGPQASTGSIKNLGSAPKISQPAVGQGSGTGVSVSQSKAMITSSQGAVNSSQLKVSPSISSTVRAPSRLSQSASATPSKLALAASRGSQVHSSKIAITPSKANATPASRLELLANSKISLSRTGLSPSVLAAGSKAVVASQIAFSPSKANISSRMGLDRSASRADRLRSLDQRVNLARQALSGSTMSIRHIDYEAEKNKGPRYMNTYRMDSKYPFNPDKVEKVMKEVFDSTLEDIIYEPRQAARLACTMSAEIRNRVKTFQFERYKIVVIVDIGEKQAQSLFSGFRYLWDVERDFYSMYKFENVTLFAVGCCYGVYHE